MIEFALAMPLLLVVFLGGWTGGLLVDGRVIGAEAVRAGATTAAALGDGSASATPETQAQVDQQVVAATVAVAKQMPHTTLRELDIYRPVPNDPNSGAFDSANDLFDRFTFNGQASWVPDPTQQSFLLVYRTQQPPDKIQVLVGVHLVWNYDPPSASQSVHLRLTEDAVMPLQKTPSHPSTPGISVSGIQGNVYAMANAGDPMWDLNFNANPHPSPQFSQAFPVINFDPYKGAITGCSSVVVNQDTHPFTDVNPADCSTLPVQGGGFEAGCNPPGQPCASASNTINASQFPGAFCMVIRATFHIAAPGSYTFRIFSDDGWILGIGPGGNSGLGKASPDPSQTLVHNWPSPPAAYHYTAAAGSPSPAAGYPVVAAWNAPSSPAARTFGVDFPEAGAYPVELDYMEIDDNDLSLTIGTQYANPIPAQP